LSYLYTHTQEVNFKVCLASLSITSYAEDAVYQIDNMSGNLSLSVNSGVITLPSGRYMAEAYPYADQASTSDVIKFIWQENSSGSYADVGISGQVQVSGDAIGEKDVALAVVDKENTTNLRLVVKTLTSTGTPTDSGGCIVIWKEE
jgi:hypothetical protein